MMPISKCLRERNRLVRALQEANQKIAALAVREGYVGFYEVEFDKLSDYLDSQGEDVYGNE